MKHSHHRDSKPVERVWVVEGDYRVMRIFHKESDAVQCVAELIDKSPEYVLQKREECRRERTTAYFTFYDEVFGGGYVSLTLDSYEVE